MQKKLLHCKKKMVLFCDYLNIIDIHRHGIIVCHDAFIPLTR